MMILDDEHDGSLYKEFYPYYKRRIDPLEVRLDSRVFRLLHQPEISSISTMVYMQLVENKNANG